MFNILVKTVILLLVLTSFHLHAEEFNFKPGLWEISSSIEMIDVSPELKLMMEGVVSRPMQVKKCIKSVANMFDPEPDDAEQCKTKINRIGFNKMSFENLCTDPEGGFKKSAGEMNFNGKSFTSQFESSLSDKVHSNIMKMKIVSNAKYIGTCD